MSNKREVWVSPPEVMLTFFLVTLRINQISPNRGKSLGLSSSNSSNNSHNTRYSNISGFSSIRSNSVLHTRTTKTSIRELEGDHQSSYSRSSPWLNLPLPRQNLAIRNERWHIFSQTHLLNKSNLFSTICKRINRYLRLKSDSI